MTNGNSERLLLALFPLLGYDFYEISSEINKTLAEINEEAMYGLHQRSQRTEVQIVTSSKMIEELTRRTAKAEEDRKKLLQQIKELEAAHQRLITQNQELKDMLEQESEQDDQRRLSSFQDLLGVSRRRSSPDIALILIGLE